MVLDAAVLLTDTVEGKQRLPDYDPSRPTTKQLPDSIKAFLPRASRLLLERTKSYYQEVPDHYQSLPKTYYQELSNHYQNPLSPAIKSYQTTVVEIKPYSPVINTVPFLCFCMYLIHFFFFLSLNQGNSKYLLHTQQHASTSNKLGRRCYKRIY